MIRSDEVLALEVIAMPVLTGLLTACFGRRRWARGRLAISIVSAGLVAFLIWTNLLHKCDSGDPNREIVIRCVCLAIAIYGIQRAPLAIATGLTIAALTYFSGKHFGFSSELVT